MIGFRVNGEFLDLDSNTQVQIELNNPLFNSEFEKGMLTYDFSGPLSEKNQRLMGFAGSISIRHTGSPAIPCQCWILNQLWRVGKLRLLERGNGYRWSFQSDAADLDTAVSDMLRESNLGSTPFAAAQGENYALLPVHNTGYYKEKPADYFHFMNRWVNGAFSEAPLVPFPKLVYVLEKVMARYGYTVSGDWLTDPATQRRVIFNVVEQVVGQTLQFEHHVPDIKVSEFLKAIRKRYGLALVFRSKTKELHIVRLQDALANPGYADWSEITQSGYTWEPNETDGWLLKDAVDSSDNRLKDAPEDSLQWKYGNGKEEIDTGIGSTSTVENLLVVDQLGGTAADSPKFGFRVLQFFNEATPRGEAETIAGLSSAYTNWFAWRSETEATTRSVNLRVADILSLDPLQKVLINSEEGVMKAFWEKLEITISSKGSIKAKGRFLKVMN